MSEELKPCPFCGSSGAILDEPLNEDEYGCFCNALCGAIGPCDEDGEKAVEFWNTRPIEDALRARIAELEEKQRWRVVANGELPEDGEVVWLWDGKYIGMGYYLVFAGQFMDRDTPLRRIKPTHWMPLPESPNDTQTQTIVYRKESEE